MSRSSSSAAALVPGQMSFDDLGTPLHEVTFCVIDIETTGSDRGGDSITEIGAVKVRGGEPLGTFGTLVNPGCAIPPTITILTGISDGMVAAAPPISEVLPALQEFVGDSVIVGHNIGFDLAFLDAALRRTGRDPFSRPVVDTLPLARRLLRDEVPDCRLGTLARHLRLTTRPTHRALDDSLATTELLHLLLERAGTMGVVGLDDLMALPTMGGHPQASKLRLTHSLPRGPGVYRFLDGAGRTLYVGKATNLRARVRSYFSNDERRKIGAMLRETQQVAHTPLPNALVAEVLESRYLHRLAPRYNRVGTTWQKYCYVRLTTEETFPRLVVTSEPSGAGLHIGPLPSRAMAMAVVEAIQTALPIRRCATRVGPRRRPRPDATPCRGAQLGVALCPCTGELDETTYWPVVQQVIAALTSTPSIVLDPLWRRVESLAVTQRYEEAAATRDRALAVTQALSRQRLIDQLRAAGDVGLRWHDSVLHLRDGVLVGVQTEGQLSLDLELAAPDLPPPPMPLPRDAADEVLLLARAIERGSHHVRVLWCSGEWAWPARPLPEVTRLGMVA